MEISPNLAGLIGFVFLFLLILLRMPIALAFAIVGFLGLVYVVGFKPALTVLPTTVWQYTTSYTLMAVPLFILMGMFVYYSGIGPDLYNAASKWFGRLPGGLAVSTTWGCASFAACTGSSVAGILTFTPIAYKPMLDLKYSASLALGAICCGATMGQIIPPSIGFLIYGDITEESVGRLFMAGIFPGLLEAVLYSIVIISVVRLGIWSGPPGATSTWKEKLVSLKGVWGALSLFILVIGGIYMGIFTPTEAAAVGAFGSLVILMSKRRFKWIFIKDALVESLRTSCMIFTIIIGSMIFARFIALSGLSFLLADEILSLNIPPMGILVTTLFCFLLLGCIMPAITMILLTVPLLYPVLVHGLGFNGIWFGVLVVVTIEIALLTPPIGMNLFAIKGLLKEEARMEDIIRGVVPFVIADIIRLVLLLAFPAISLWLPGKMYTRR